jgi:hypothetical protein
MSKKPDLSKAFGERFKTEQKVEVQNPFEVVLSQPLGQESVQESKDVRMHARTNESEQESKHIRQEASEEAYIGKGVIIEVLYDQIQQKKHLSNGSFRYKADELEKLDAIFKDLESRKPGRISKNDIARMALIAFYEDYEKNGDESILAQVFRRM